MGEKEKKVIKTISEDQKLGQLMNENKTDKNVSRKTPAPARIPRSRANPFAWFYNLKY